MIFTLTTITTQEKSVWRKPRNPSPFSSKQRGRESNPHLQVGVCEHKLPNKGVIGEAPHALSNCEHKVDGGGVEAVAGREESIPGLAHIHDAVLHHFLGIVHVCDVTLLAGLVDAEDASCADTRIQVAGAIQGVKHHHVVACMPTN